MYLFNTTIFNNAELYIFGVEEIREIAFIIPLLKVLTTAVILRNI